MDRYMVVARDAVIEFVEKRSRFIGHVWYCSEEAQALERIKEMREKHWDATHNVYAYIIKDGPTRFSDDGEPSGTAGMPVLEVFKREGINNVCCVVTRYFGGILLGAGGLVRAYAAAAKQALDAAGINEMHRFAVVSFNCPYQLFERVRLETVALNGAVERSDFGEYVDMDILLPEENVERFVSRLTEMSSGTVKPVISGYKMAAVPFLNEN